MLCCIVHNILFRIQYFALVEPYIFFQCRNLRNTAIYDNSVTTTKYYSTTKQNILNARSSKITYLHKNTNKYIDLVPNDIYGLQKCAQFP